MDHSLHRATSDLFISMFVDWPEPKTFQLFYLPHIRNVLRCAVSALVDSIKLKTEFIYKF